MNSAYTGAMHITTYNDVVLFTYNLGTHTMSNNNNDTATMDNPNGREVKVGQGTTLVFPTEKAAREFSDTLPRDRAIDSAENRATELRIRHVLADVAIANMTQSSNNVDQNKNQ